MPFHNVAWDACARLLRDHANASAPRFTYDRGTLEIMSPLPEHERTVPSTVTSEALTALLPASKDSGDIAWIQRVRAWARALPDVGKE